MKRTIETLLVIFVFPVRITKQENMFTGRSEKVEVPTGECHIFEVYVTHLPKVKGVDKPQVFRETAYLSFCGKARSDIGVTTSASDVAPHHKICSECEKIYKNHPRSPWKNFVEGKAIQA